MQNAHCLPAPDPNSGALRRTAREEKHQGFQRNRYYSDMCSHASRFNCSLNMVGRRDLDGCRPGNAGFLRDHNFGQTTAMSSSFMLEFIKGDAKICKVKFLRNPLAFVTSFKDMSNSLTVSRDITNSVMHSVPRRIVPKFMATTSSP